MLPAQPPKLRRMPGTRNDTFNICILSGRMCSLNLPLNTMMVSYAIEPQINADIVLNLLISNHSRVTWRVGVVKDSHYHNTSNQVTPTITSARNTAAEPRSLA